MLLYPFALITPSTSNLKSSQSLSVQCANLSSTLDELEWWNDVVLTLECPTTAWKRYWEQVLVIRAVGGFDGSEVHEDDGRAQIVSLHWWGLREAEDRSQMAGSGGTRCEQRWWSRVLCLSYTKGQLNLYNSSLMLTRVVNLESLREVVLVTRVLAVLEMSTQTISIDARPCAQITPKFFTSSLVLTGPFPLGFSLSCTWCSMVDH